MAGIGEYGFPLNQLRQTLTLREPEETNMPFSHCTSFDAVSSALSLPQCWLFYFRLLRYYVREQSKEAGYLC